MTAKKKAKAVKGKQSRKDEGKSQKGTIIFILGTDSTERDVIIDLTLKGSRKMLPKLTRVRLPKLKLDSHKRLGSRRKRFAGEFEKILSSGKNFIVSGSIVSRTQLGFVPLFEDGFPQGVRPDAIILLEVDTRELIVLPGHGFARRKDLEALEETKVHQQFHRQYAGSTGSPVKILKLEKCNVKKSLRELREYLLRVMK